MASMHTFPFEYPTTVTLVDDDSAFLASLSLALRTHGTVRTTTSPDQAVGLIEAQAPMLSRLNRTDGLPPIDDIGRFDVSSILVTDYEMGPFNGIDLCRQVGDSPVGRILLTGKVDERVAVRAFNEDIIDRYVRKDDPQMVGLLARFIGELRTVFFRRGSAPVNEERYRERARFLFDPRFAEYFERSRRDNEVVEYYLGSAFPGFIMLDAEGEVLLFTVLTERQMADHVETAENRDAPRELLELLRAGMVIPFFPGEEGYYSPEYRDSWKDWTFTAKTIDGTKRYYHSIISGPAAQAAVRNMPVAPYNRFLATR